MSLICFFQFHAKCYRSFELLLRYILIERNGLCSSTQATLGQVRSSEVSRFFSRRVSEFDARIKGQRSITCTEQFARVGCRLSFAWRELNSQSVFRSQYQFAQQYQVFATLKRFYPVISQNGRDDRLFLQQCKLLTNTCKLRAEKWPHIPSRQYIAPAKWSIIVHLQFLGPALNGMYAYGLRPTQFSGRKWSGLKCSGRGNTFLSRCSTYKSQK